MENLQVFEWDVPGFTNGHYSLVAGNIGESARELVRLLAARNITRFEAHTHSGPGMSIAR